MICRCVVHGRKLLFFVQLSLPMRVYIQNFRDRS